MAASVHGSNLLLAGFLSVVLILLHNVEGTGHIEVHFIEYSDTCLEDLGTNRCDPMFTFCLGTPQRGQLTVDKCTYESTGQSGDVFGNTNYLQLEWRTSIGGLKNPWIVQVKKFIEPSVMLVVRVVDADWFDDDLMQIWGKTLNEPIWPSQEQAVWQERVMSQNSYIMRFKVRMYCDAYYYTQTCDKYCKPNDSSSGHYTCDANGDKQCMPGWKGSECTEDVDECALQVCVRGTCTNKPGDYTCECPANYTGKNCSFLMNPCREQPCLNGGTCFAHPTEHIYICQCTPEYEGKICESQKPAACVKNPCMNNGTCASSSGSRSYSCSCVGPYTGDDCEIVVTTQPTSTGFETSQTSLGVTIADTTTSPSDTYLHISQEDNKGGFHLWYIAIIIAILLAIVIVVVILFVRRRRSKAKKSPTPSGPVISYTGDDLNFDNGGYSTVNRNNSEIDRHNRGLPPVPAVRRQDDGMKSTYAVVDESEGATGGSKPGDSDVKKITPDVQKKTGDSALGALTHPANERAQTNPYADFKTLRDSEVVSYKPTDGHHEEEPYQDLDTVSANMNTGYDQQDSADGTFSYIIPDTPIVTVQTSPYDSPPNNSSYYDTPKGNLPSPLVPAQMTNSDSSPYINCHDSDSSDDENILQEDILKLRGDVEANNPTSSKS